jgi:hypothetical protein
LPFVFAVWVAQRSTSVDRALAVHATLMSRGPGGSSTSTSSRIAPHNRQVSIPEPVAIPERIGLPAVLSPPRRAHELFQPTR